MEIDRIFAAQLGHRELDEFLSPDIFLPVLFLEGVNCRCRCGNSLAGDVEGEEDLFVLLVTGVLGGPGG